VHTKVVVHNLTEMFSEHSHPGRITTLHAKHQDARWISSQRACPKNNGILETKF